MAVEVPPHRPLPIQHHLLGGPRWRRRVPRREPRLHAIRYGCDPGGGNGLLKHCSRSASSVGDGSVSVHANTQQIKKKISALQVCNYIYITLNFFRFCNLEKNQVRTLQLWKVKERRNSSVLHLQLHDSEFLQISQTCNCNYIYMTLNFIRVLAKPSRVPAPPPDLDKDKAPPTPKPPKPKPKPPKSEPELNTRSASASAPEHDQTAGPYGTVRATTGKGEEKETLTLNLKEEGREGKEACSPERRWRPEERAVRLRIAPLPPSRPGLRCAAAPLEEFFRSSGE
uniref:Uncharacterized protein n=1 Tax=Oryza barthii TaxID=65489 RepID=A0A0D3GEM7_9ORYZ